MLKRWSGQLGIGLWLGISAAAFAQLPGEEYEPTPEYLDANFTAEDAARVAAGFSDTLIDPDASRNSVDGMTDAADLVIRGMVLTQTYEYDERGTPSTHTTLSIAEQMKGDHPVPQITIIQPGGPAENDPELVMMVSDAQYFNVGEEELLFLDMDPGNPTVALRTTVLSRFRVFENRVYSADGHGIHLVPIHGDSGYALEHSIERHPDERFRRIRIGSRWLNTQSGGHPQFRDGAAGRGAQPRLAQDAPAPQGADVDAFSNLVRSSGGVR